MAAIHADKSLVKYATAVILRDGSTLQLRAIQREDEEKLLALFYPLHPHTSQTLLS